MWELIASNRRKSILLLAGMGLFFAAFGFAFGALLFGPDAAPAGLAAAGIIFFILSFTSFFFGDSILLSMSRAKPVTHDVHPQLFNVVEEMRIAAGLPKMPKIYIIDESSPNAFATGIRLDDASVAVTAGLLARLNRDELQGVVAHEVSHIVNRDVLFLTVAGLMLGSVQLLADIFFRGTFRGSSSSRRYRSERSGGGQAQLLILVVAVVFAVLAPILIRLFYFSLSRRREYLADASAARFTRYPEGLASALEKISSASPELSTANAVTAPMFIVSPSASGSAMGLFATHPPVEERIRVLRAMTSGADFRSYERAFASAAGKSSGVVPASALETDRAVPIRPPSAAEPSSGAPVKRDAGDLMRAVNGYAFLICACGLRIKVPPEYREPSARCPRCGREQETPFAALAAAVAIAAPVSKTAAPAAEVSKFREYRRRGTGWESFACVCGKLTQLSPLFIGDTLTCSKCGAVTRVISSS